MTYKRWLRQIEKLFVKRGFSREYGNATAMSYANHYHDAEHYALPIYIVNLHIGRHNLG